MFDFFHKVNYNTKNMLIYSIMKTQLTVINSGKNFENLQLLLVKKQIFLGLLMKKLDNLNSQLTDMQDEYERRIGSLIRKERILDNEINRYRKIKELIKKGLSLENAYIEVTKDEELFQDKNIKHDNDSYLDIEDMNQAEKDIENITRKLWKKLAWLFHPDLSKNDEDRKKRENIMKQINNAYSEKNLIALKAIEERGLLEIRELSASDDITTSIQDIENALIRIKNKFKELKESRWYVWRNKTRKEKNALFIDFERESIRDVLRKEIIFETLKRQLGIKD
ncbi:hypothetical protein LBMAG33_3750 [Candidatus Levyibacteriota bacterium]|nr:hypothetical protein LBMAG33_3750 [Candidatus Levybacteria bacterium]